MDISVGGHICLDVIPAWEKGNLASIKPGKLLEMEGINFSTGGAVANTGLSLKKLGIDVGLVGKIGDDALGSITLDILQEHGAHIADSMIVSKEETSSYTIVLNPPDTDRAFLHYPGPNNTFTADDIPYDFIKKSKIFHFGYPPLMKKMYRNDGHEISKMFQKTSRQGLINSLDMTLPDPNSEAGRINWPKLLEKILPFVDIFLPSFEEISYMLRGEKLTRDRMNLTLLHDMSAELLDMGVEIVVLKLGDQGLYLHSTTQIKRGTLKGIIDSEKWSDQEMVVPCFKEEVLAGTTGAGDAAIAGFLADLLSGNRPAEVLNTAAAVGAYCVEAVDATGGIEKMPAVKKRIEKGWERLPLKFNLEDWNFNKKRGLWIK